MNIIVFVGPTLARTDAVAELDAACFPPASQGDIYLAVRERPWGIGLIDGYFKQVPAVWHKEILWAMSQGVHVFGAASMGALRAAELGAYGMVGVGRVYEDFASGRLEDDDEVAIAHADGELDYLALSDAMVNIRANFGAACDDGVITPEFAARLLAIAKQTFYPQRTYERVLTTARNLGLERLALDRLAQWLALNRFDQKRIDALQLLRSMRIFREQHPGPMVPRFRFQHTDAWEQVRRQIDLKPLNDSNANAHRQGDAVLSELRLRGDAYERARDAALLHALCHELAAGSEARVEDSLLADALAGFRVRHGLVQPGSVEPWLREQGLDVGALTQLLLRDINTQRYRALFEAETERLLIQHLRMAGEYTALNARANAKHDLLHEVGLHNPSLEAAGIDEKTLWHWYFVDHLGMDEQTDPVEFARTLGCSARVLRRDVLREWLYRQHSRAVT